MTKILLADDELSMRSLIGRILIENGYEFCAAEDGEEAIELFKSEHPDLIILDVMMPVMDGYTACHALRTMGADIPVIFLTAKGDIADMGSGFGVGGDDYMVKPFDARELLMRIEAHLRRYERTAPKAQDESSLKIGDFEFEIAYQRVSLKEHRIDLTAKEFKILYLLASHENEAFTREQIIEAVWGEEFVGETSSLPVFIRRIREKIEEDPSHPIHLQTAWRSGYRFSS